MRELVVYNEPAPCPYLPGETARMPLRRPLGIQPRDFDVRLSQGDRRLGRFLYRPACADCHACEAIRIPIAEFTPLRTQRRVLKKGFASLRLQVGPPQCDDDRIALYNRHKQGRSLAHGDDRIDLDGYLGFLVESCVETLEFSYWQGDRLVAVGISDRGETCLSAVYCYFDPELPSLSLGTFNVLAQIEWCRALELRYLYLGYYIALSPHMNYKCKFLPHERLIGGTWNRFEREG